MDINDAETCNLLCGQCNATSVFANSLCECSLTDNNNEGIILLIRIFLTKINFSNNNWKKKMVSDISHFYSLMYNV